MSSIGSEEVSKHLRPRPGLVKALGITNIVISMMTTLCMVSSMAWIFIAIMSPVEASPVVAEASPSAAPVVADPAPDPAPAASPPKSGGPMPVINPFVGMDNRDFVRFSIADAATSTLLNGLMFVTGLGLINLKRWGARGWTWLAWIKIGRLWLFWGFFIVAVAPSFSESLATAVVAMFQQQGGIRGKVPTVGEFTRIYSIMCLILAIGMIAFGTIYPAISLWLLGRPGVKAALIGKPLRLEQELS
jgi:hypothetical protein